MKRKVSAANLSIAITFLLVLLSFGFGYRSYSQAEQRVVSDLNQALQRTVLQHKGLWLNADTIQTYAKLQEVMGTPVSVSGFHRAFTEALSITGLKDVSTLSLHILKKNAPATVFNEIPAGCLASDTLVWLSTTADASGLTLSFRGALGALYGNGNTPIQVAAHGTRLQAHVEPALALAINIGTPLLMVFQNPLAKPFLVFVQRQIPVLRLTHHGLAAADGTLRINQVRGAEAGAALLALVAVSAFGMAVGALAGDVAVGKEGLGFFVVILHAGLFDEFSLIVQLAEEVGSRVVMRL